MRMISPRTGSRLESYSGGDKKSLSSLAKSRTANYKSDHGMISSVKFNEMHTPNNNNAIISLVNEQKAV